MPYLNIRTNIEIPADKHSVVLKEMSAAVARMLGKSEQYVMVDLETNSHMLFAGDASPLAYLQLKSIGLPENRTKEFSSTLCELIGNRLGIESERVYIDFIDVPRHLWGWNNGTF